MIILSALTKKNLLDKVANQFFIHTPTNMNPSMYPNNYDDYTSHWTYWLQILSKLCFQWLASSGNYEIMAISTDKNTFLMTLIIKLTLGKIFYKSEKSTRRQHRHKIIKTNLKTLVSPLLTRPQGSQGCQKMLQDPINMPVEV